MIYIINMNDTLNPKVMEPSKTYKDKLRYHQNRIYTVYNLRYPIDKPYNKLKRGPKGLSQ